ncbi:MAG TPA: sulfate ABC transporter ATP-binding protein [bacterium]|nr:sulfate ABC transporter ATP-binding protein [bacterium]
MGIEVRNITKRFGEFTALDNVSLRVPKGDLVALLGPSGCGKTTLLRIIAGLENADEGRVLFDGEDATHHRVQERRVGFVFQHYALFRHMTVFENVAFGLRVKPKRFRPSEQEIKDRVQELLGLVHLEWLADQYPSQLSGGQRQRVALSRALAVEPKVLLLDEPFGALDAQVRKSLRRWLRRLHDEIHVTSVFVTHDQEEALEVADRVVIMKDGTVVQSGTPVEVYEQPATAFVYKFLGNVNHFPGTISEGKAHVGNMAFDLPAEAQGQTASIYVRPHEMILDHSPFGDRCFRASVRHINPAGPYVKVELITDWGESVDVEISREEYQRLNLTRDAEVYASPRETKIYLEQG